ncbi:MAG: hypothetical protein NE327_14235 [Lentisphaeraceae bacterium]|nr:hypothetical protein [Lentisphaeraceae bacterium]
MRKATIAFISVLLLSFSLQAAETALAEQFNMKISDFRVNAVPAKEAFAQFSDLVKKEDPAKKGLLIIFKAKKSKKISLNVSALPVIEVIKYLCLSGNYRYKITGRTVNITDK